MKHIISAQNFNWHYYSDNSEETIKEIQNNFSNFHELDYEDIVSGPQQPKSDFYDDYIFSIFHFADYNTETKRIHVVELDVFLGKDFLITISKNKSKTLDDFFEKLSNDKEALAEASEHGSGFLLYKIIDLMTDACWPVIRKISSQITDIEEDIYSEDTRKKTVWNIAFVKRNLIRLKRILNPQTLVVASLTRNNKSYLPQDLNIYFDDINDTLNRMLSITEGHVDVMNSLHQVSESLISQRTNEVITVLAVISVAFLPMTLLTSFYGMNIDLPFVSHPGLIWIIFGVVLFLVIAALLYFKKKELL